MPIAPKRLVLLCMILVLLAGTFPARAQEGDPPFVHIVQPGENLYRIALNYGLTVDALMIANGLLAPDLVVVGQALVIPGRVAAGQGLTSGENAPASGEAAAGWTPAGLTHTIAPGESLRDIARRYGITLDVLLAANDIAHPSLITVGQTLLIPDGGGESTLTGAEAFPMVLDFSHDPGITTPDFGIIVPGSTRWDMQPNLITSGGATTRDIFLRGQALGNDPHAFSKIGDCNSEPPFFLAKFDKGEYVLGDYAYLQPVIEQFAGSFIRESATVWTGNHAWALFDPVWANPTICQPGETPLDCEFRVHRPSLALIRLGTNEAGSTPLFEFNLRQIIETSIERGVIPVLGTKADRIEGSDQHNAIIRKLAAEYGVPLWDFGRVADTLPGRGLMADGFHLSYVPPDYTAPEGLQTGHSVQNLMALMALNTVWRHAMY